MDVIKVQGIPLFTGNLEQLEKDALAFKTIAGKIRKTGSDIHTGFGGLKSFYSAPEAEKLFASTAPVRDTADDFAGELEWIWSALDSYAIEIRPIVEKLKSLQTQASLFMASVEGDDYWDKDQDKVDEHNKIFDAVTAAAKAFRAAEERAADSIAMLHGGMTLKEKAKAYEAREGKSDKPEELPWGKPAKKRLSHVERVNRHVYNAVEGFFVDGVWGTIDGLLTLAGFHGTDEMQAAWKGLAMIATGASIWLTPSWRDKPESELPPFLRESKQIAKETAKSVVAYDMWKENPGRATGVVVFNGLTAIAAPTKAGQAANAASKGAKAINAIRQGGHLVDPMTYIFKGASKGLGKIPMPKLSTILSSLDNLIKVDGPNPASLQHALDNAVEMPDKTVRVPINDHEFAYIRKSDGALLDENGQLLRKGVIPKTEPSAAERLQGEDVSLARDHELAGVGGRGNDLNATNRADDNVTPPGSRGTPDSASDDNLSHHGHDPDDGQSVDRSEASADHGWGDSGTRDGAAAQYVDAELIDDLFPDEVARGSDAPLPPPDEIKQALIGRGLSPSSRSYTPEDGHAYATRVFAGGRPDGETVFAGHGYLRRGSGETVVPEGTTISFYVPDGDRIPGLNGLAVESGVYPEGGYVVKYEAGERIPDYTLAAPEGTFGMSFSIMEGSVTVAERTLLSKLLKPNMGSVHWAACREHS
ncbi:putative adhesin [Streptomyces sp. P1-3]|uniref:putative adhesin n=1 Tax=Streptomyces sp. P1-3 TaxID=3421658 RepID=UPI003D35A914